MLFDPDIEDRITKRMDTLVRAFALEPHDRGIQVAAFAPETRGLADSSFTSSEGDHFEQTLSAHIKEYGFGYPCTWIEETISNLTEPALGRAAISTVRFIKFVHEGMRKIDLGENDPESYKKIGSYARHVAKGILIKLLDRKSVV